MSSLAHTAQLPVGPVSAAVQRFVPRRWRTVGKWLGAMLLGVALCLGALACPPVWHGVLRTVLQWQAARHDCELTIGEMTGGPFAATQFSEVRLRQKGSTSENIESAAGRGTDITIARAEVGFAWRFPWVQHSGASWVRELAFAGVRGRLDLAVEPVARDVRGVSSVEGTAILSSPALGGETKRRRDGSGARWVPAIFSIQADDLLVRRNRYQMRMTGLRLSGSRDGAGEIVAAEVKTAGPGFANTFTGWRGQTFWKGNRLTLAGLSMGDGVVLTRATLDGSRLGRRRLDWECCLDALGGEVRGQGAINFSHEHLGLEIAATLRKTALGPLARMVGIPGPVDGQVEQASFTFRGEPENWASAQMWLSGRATDFRWEDRRWQSLETQAVLVNRHIQIHRLELRQDRNSLSLSGDCPLPPGTRTEFPWTGNDRWWQAAGFSCHVDARLEDLHALTRLIGPALPELGGRMSVNGNLAAAPGHAEIAGYLNVEGTRLKIGGAPLDYLRSTLVFREGALEVADLQATQDADYFTSHGVIGLAGARNYRGELRAEIKDLGVYTPALARFAWMDEALASVTGLTAILRLEDSVLHFDQCKGKQAGDEFQVSGQADLREAGRASLDLHLQGRRHLDREAPVTAAFRTDAACSLDIRGPTDGKVTLGGEIRLADGEFQRQLEFTPESAESAVDFLPLSRWLPEACADWTLDLRITSQTPLPVKSGGEVTPDLRIDGTGRDPRTVGKLVFRHVTALLPEGKTTTFDERILAVGAESPEPLTPPAQADAANENSDEPEMFRAVEKPGAEESAETPAPVISSPAVELYPHLR